jgi:hypothetical protein
MDSKLITTIFVLGTLAYPALAQAPEMAIVVSKPVSRTIALPGEIQPFLNVSLRMPRVRLR